MKRKSNITLGLIILVLVSMLLVLVPAQVSATVYPSCRFYGPVTRDGLSIPAGSTITAWIGDLAAASTQAYNQGSESWYNVEVQPNSGNGPKNGGVEGDIVRFTVTINGSSWSDVTTGIWQSYKDIYHRIAVNGQGTVPFDIITTALNEASQGQPYSFTVEASGGVSPFDWSAHGLPAGLNIEEASGNINGIPSVWGDFTVEISVIDSGSPANNATKSFNLRVLPVPITINTTSLARWPVEVFPANPPASWLPLPQAGWIIGQSYDFSLTAAGGSGNYIWSAANLPPGLAVSAAGSITGAPTAEGLFDITFTAEDDQNPPFTTSSHLILKIYKQGDANGSGSVSIADVTYAERVLLGLEAPTAGTDGNLSGTLSIADVTRIERIILGLP
jgi:hypothetical protein